MLNLKNKDFDKKIEELMSGMSIEEKIGQLVQYGRLKEAEDELINQGEIGSFLNFNGAVSVNEKQKKILESKNPIPILIGDDVIHGYKTTFPIPLAESCSWDLELMEETSAIAAKEASTEGVHCIFAPMVDIARDPRWGRVAEGAGEDTYLGSLIARARVRGIQRNNWNDRPQITACPKHFLGYGAAEGGRDYNSVDLSERSIRETYLPPFAAALDEGAGTIMCSFNDLNGVPASGNKFLLDQILRQELGFEGAVISDWESIEELVYHGLAKDKKEAAIKAIEAGVEIDMHSGSYKENLLELVHEGKVSEELIDRAVRRLLRVKLAVKLFETPYTDPILGNEIIRAQEHIDKALEAAKKSVVLLKNDGILPLKKDVKSIAIIGPMAKEPWYSLGCWAGKCDPSKVATIFDGIVNKLGDKVEIHYAQGSEIFKSIKNGVTEALKAAEKAEVVILAVGDGDQSGENRNRVNIDIPKPQREFIEAIKKTGKSIVMVLVNGRPLALEWEHENINAIVEAWNGGEQAGNAAADVLFGDYNPSGKLTMTFPRNVGQVPIYYNYKNTGRPTFKRYLDSEDTPLYPFGYGLSYTTFEYSNIKLSSKKLKLGESLKVSAEVKNTGRIEGEEVVQLYIRDITASITRPVKELKGFRKISLKPDESKVVEFELTDKELGFLDEDFNFVVEPGAFKVWIAKNSVEGLEEDFEIVK